MARFNNYNGNRYDFRNSGQDRYQQQNWGKKKSGAKEGRQKAGKNQGKVYVSGWKANKRHGMVKISAFENARSTRSRSESGNEFVTMMFEIFYKDTGAKVLEVAPYNLTTGKVFLEKVGWCISTKARNGGYVGPIS